jgi:hypothetical protein
MIQNHGGKMKNFRGILIIIMLAASALACNFPTASKTATATPTGIDLDATVAAISMEQTQTSIAAYLNPTQTSEAAGPTRTPMQETPASPTSQPAATIAPSATIKPKPCNAAMFIADITYEDNTIVNPGEPFTKTWRLENVGTCTWTSSYRLVYDHGDKMGAANSVQLTNSPIAPGMTVDASIELIAPDDGGTYQGYFLLRSGDGQVFGINSSAIDPFWVLIKVPNPTAVPEQKAEIEITNFELCAAPKKGVPCQVSVSVYNNGTKKTGPYQIQFYQSDSAPAGCSWNMDNNAKGGQTVTCMYTFPSFYNNIKTRVVADVGNVVPESDESNNVQYLTVDVAP